MVQIHPLGPTMETITQAAILLEGKVWTGRRHCHIIAEIAASTNICPVRGIQGFVTSACRFVDRKEAAKLALASGQVNHLKFQPDELFSEDVW